MPALLLGQFRFQIPEGFRDLSPGVPESNFRGVPDPVRAEAKSGKFVAFAMDLREEDGFYENFNALVTDGALYLDADTWDEEAQKLSAALGQAVGERVELLESELVIIQGVPAAMRVYDVTMSGISMRQMQFLIPGETSFATLTYVATRETFSRYRPVFDAAARATLGAAAPKRGGIDWDRVIRRGFYGAMIGAFIGLILKLTQRGKGKKRPPLRRPPRPPSHAGS